jgi:hypothetical protein
MHLSDKLTNKKDVYNICLKILSERIEVCKTAIASAQQASNEEEKSSAGDKFETSRAMNHLEKEMYSKQLQANLHELAALQLVQTDNVYETVRPGAYIVCKEFDVFIAAGLGKIKQNDRLVYLLSPEAPLASTIKNKKAGDGFLLNKLEEKILDVY